MGLLPNPWVILGLVFLYLSTAGLAYWKGHADADRSAEVSALNDELATTRAALRAKQEEAKHNAQVADEFRQREEAAGEAIQKMQETIDDIQAEEANKPATDVCRFAPGPVFDQLRDLAKRAAGHNAFIAPDAGDIRKAGPRTPSP